MRLLSCEIENFGKLSNFKYNFDDGLNVISQNNGWGKSTLIAFIKAMFYGMEKTTKRNIDENERKKFLPWQGGNYGGSITFSVGEKKYKAERLFNVVSGVKVADESFALIDLSTGKTSKDYTKDLGEELFEVDSKGFERSAFMSQNSLGLLADNTSISNRLAQILNNTGDDMKDYDSALNILDKAGKVLEKRGKKGLIADLEEQQSSIKVQLMGYNTTDDDIKNLEEKKFLLDEELKDKNKELIEIKQQLKNSNKRASEKHYMDQKNELDDLFSEKLDLENKYPNLIDADAFLEEVEDKIAQASKMMELNIEKNSQKALKNASYIECTEEILQKTCSYIEKYDEHLSVIEEKNNIDKRIEDSYSFASKEKAKKDHNYKDCTSGDLSKTNDLIDKYSQENRVAVKEKKFNFLSVLLTVLAIISIVGIIILIVIKKRKSEDDISDDTKQLNEEIITFLKKFNQHYSKENELLSALYNAKMAITANLTIDNELEKIYEEVDKLKVNSNDKNLELQSLVADKDIPLDEEIQKFIKRINQTSSIENEIKSTLYEAKMAIAVNLAIEEKVRSIVKAAEELRSNLISFFNKYHLTIQEDMLLCIRSAKNDILKLKEMCKEIDEKKVKLDNIIRENNIDVSKISIDDEFMPVEQLEEKESNLTNQIEDLANKVSVNKKLIENKTDDYNLIRDLTLDKEVLAEEIETAKKQHFAITTASEKLEIAKDNLSTKYLKPMEESFINHYKSFDGDDIEIELDTELNLKIKAKNQAREVAYFSQGIKDRIGLSMRFALVDALFEKEVPFIVIDDPFVNLDDKRLELALNFIKTISEKMQVIYLTCSDARACTLAL